MRPEVNDDVPIGQEQFIDLVQIRAEGAFGTGLLVGPGLAITALHCVCDPDRSWRVRDTVGVYLLRELGKGREHHYPARIVWPQADVLGQDPPPDVAILQIEDDDPPAAHIPHRFGQVPRAPTLGSALGFPGAARGSQLPGDRVEHDQPGIVHQTSVTRHALTIYPIGRHRMEGLDRWAGLSGGPLFANGFIVGVMREVPDGWGGEAIEAEPLAPLLQDKTDRSLRALLGVDLPLAWSDDAQQIELEEAYKVIGRRANKASEGIFETAAGSPFFGRAGDLQALDDALVARDRGILLLRGEAGLGKSRLAAEWADRCARTPWTRVLRHAFSVRERATSTQDAMVSNLVRQAAELLGPQALGRGEPGDTTRLRERLEYLLATDRPDDGRLVVILDGLDEAAERIEPWSTDVGRGVFILVTSRAEAGDEPRALQMWRERALEAGVLALDRILKPIDSASIAQWLTEATRRPFVETDLVVARAMQASEGVPLFASYLISDAIEALQEGTVDPFPASFSEYARGQLTHLKDRIETVRDRDWSWSEVVELFALLAVARAPLPTAALRDLLRPQGLDGLDQRAERWLWRRQGGENETAVVSYTHPRLAAVFRTVLPKSDPDIPDLVEVAEERLIEACETAWKATGRAPLRPYALASLPAHLISQGRSREAADLLGDGAFLLARLRGSPTTATVHATASETITLGPSIDAAHPASDWRRFWTETEGKVVAAIDRAASLGVSAEGALAQLAHDRFGVEASAFRQLTRALPERSPRLVLPVGFRHPGLIRSLDRAHAGWVWGVLALEDGLVSWGEDGAIRFWSRDGAPRDGGNPRAHAGWVWGVLALEDGLVSWGRDGAIRFWSRDGAPRDGGDPRAHPGGVRGVLALEDGLVSWGWGGDRAIRFWSRDGAPRDGGAPRAHAGGVGGVLALEDGLVSWGGDGAIRFWSRDGAPRDGGDPRAHAGWVWGVLALEDGLVSWGGDGAIRFWSRDGAPRGGGDPRAHPGGVWGVLALEDGLVSWGGDGAIRFWSRDGAPRGGGDPRAHPVRVEGVLALEDGLVSWGRDGAIRFWSRDGAPRDGGDPRAHPGGVWGVLALEDGLVSWGGDGAIRFWSRDGAPRDGGDPRAHAGWVWGVLALEDGLVSWGGDGAIRFWSRDGAPRDGGDPRAHAGWVWGVLALEDGLVSWGGDGAIRFWSRDGAPRGGGDSRAHPGRVGGVLALEDGLVSWGGDGAIRFWSRDGAPRDGGDPRAHPGWVGGVLALEDGLVSWGDDGAIRFWSRDGAPRDGGDPRAHPGGVGGVLALEDGLVSWGRGGAIRFWSRDGAIRFWSREGAPRDGGDPRAHADWVGGVLALEDGLVSWGGDRAIRFWSRDGAPRDGGARRAHEGEVGGVLALEDGLVSWGGDGAIRFWSRDGAPRDGGARRAHEGGVGGVLALEDGLVSWGGDGAIRFWSRDGAPRDGGASRAHPGGVRGVLALEDGLVSWGRDDILRRWDSDGALNCPAWIAPEQIEGVFTIDDTAWVSLLGRPHRLDQS